MPTQSIYNITDNFDKFTKALLPIDKRTLTHVHFLEALNSQNKWLNLNLNEYIYGVTYSVFTSSATYSLYQRVNGGIVNNHLIYESIATTHSGQPLTNTSYWQYVNNNFIGASERSFYMDQKMTFEYALNRQFQTNFKQNNSATQSLTHSDIYLQDAAVQIPSFVVGITENQSSDVFDIFSTGYVINTLTFYPDQQFNINIPLTVLNQIPGTESGVRNFADKYNIAGIYYNVKPY